MKFFSNLFNRSKKHPPQSVKTIFAESTVVTVAAAEKENKEKQNNEFEHYLKQLSFNAEEANEKLLKARQKRDRLKAYNYEANIQDAIERGDCSVDFVLDFDIKENYALYIKSLEDRGFKIWQNGGYIKISF